MRLPEQRLWDAMRKAKPHGFWLQRIENVVMSGMPDVHAAGPRRASWVELKAPKRPKREATPLMGREGLNPAQINWHLKAAQMGVRSYVLVRDSEHQLFLLRGDQAAEINGWPLPKLRQFSIAQRWPDIFFEIG